MKWQPKVFSLLTSIIISNANAGIMREDVSVQDYRDFAENLGKYTPGAENVEVFKTDGTSAGILDFPIPDFGASDDTAVATLIAPSYIVSVAHNGGYTGVRFGNGAKYNYKYTIINRNIDSARDFHTPRLNKVVTDIAPADMVTPNDARHDKVRYKYFARVGSGNQYQVSPTTHKPVWITGAYKWKSGGTIINPTFENWRLRWTDYGPPDASAQPFSSAGQPGDSGSPLFVYDSLEKKWKLYGVTTSIATFGTYNTTTYVLDLQTAFINQIIASNTDPDVIDVADNGDIHWSKDAITQGDNSWVWHGVTNKALPSSATNAELDATKDLRFNGDGGLIVLDSSINHGAAKLQFSSDYRVISADGANATWVGGGIEVDADKTVDWEVNGLAGDTLHKIGEGTLYVNATGINGGGLRVGDGTVVLAQQPDKDGKRSAFSTVTLVSGRPTVKLGDEDQISGENIQFGSRGGILDLNGYDMSFSTINHNDSGARIINGNADTLSTITLNNKNAQAFIGHFGSPDTANWLNVDYTPVGDQQWTLGGGADINQLTLNDGVFAMSGRATPHAGGVIVKDDWIDETYHVNHIQVEDGSQLHLYEHASLYGDISLADHATMAMTGKSHFTDNLDLGDESSLIVDTSQSNLASTDGNTDSWLTSNVSGSGNVEKYGSGILHWIGDSTFTGLTTVYGGALNLIGSLVSDLQMKSGTELTGNLSVQNLTLEDGVTLRPYAAPSSNLLTASAFSAQSLKVQKNFTTGAGTQLYLRSQMDEAQPDSDRLLIDGDVDSSAGSTFINVDLSGDGYLTDTNNSGIAGATEGISLVQVGGLSTKDSFQLVGGYVANGPWQYSLYAFAPGKSSEDERLISGSGDQYWDYRLETRYLTEGDEPTPDEGDSGTKPDDGGNVPDDSGTKPDDGGNVPDDSGTKPDDGGNVPDDSGTKPDDGGNVPDDSGTKPDDGGNVPDDSGTKPDDGGNVPDDSGTKPDDGGNVPDDSGTKPDDGGNVPDDSGTKPDDGGNVPDDSGTKPDDGGNVPDDSGTKPDDGGNVPDDSGTKPDDGGNVPDGSGTKPDDGGNVPDDSGTKPDDGGNVPDDSGTKPDDGGTTLPPDQGGITPPKPRRIAVVPQVPSYLSLPSALLSYNSRVNQMFRNLAQSPDSNGKVVDSYPVWLQYINGEDKYHTSMGFLDYGYDYTQKEQGWLLGGRVLQLGDEHQYLTWNVGFANSTLKITPDAKDGNSESHYTTYGLTSLLTLRHQSGLTLDVGADATKYDGYVTTDTRSGHVADIKAYSYSGNAEVSYPFELGNHEISPVLGAGIQVLKVDDFTDVDDIRVHYGTITRPTGQLGIRYNYKLRDTELGNFVFYTNSYLTKDFSNTPDVWIGSTHTNGASSTFDIGKVGSSATIDVGIINEITPMFAINTGVQYQQRLSNDDEGINSWQANVGIRVTF
ncbi:S6 family peptidase [Hafnia alvei]|uniref:S6 family peptidase n=1 Tax=Hafnia alvei TaxID=569 RepID=UPI00187D2BDC|nr:S6 family peptidase [Hafnia alvei]